MPSVASQIRIDLIASADRMKAGLREGKQELGSFGEDVERFNKKFDSQKAAVERSRKELESWRNAMHSEGSFMAGGQTAFNRDPALQRQTRLRDMLPFGNTTRVEISRQAAETAAAIGEGKTKILESLAGAAREIGGQAAGAAGLGGAFSQALALTGGNPLAAGAGAAATWWIGTIHDQQARARNAHKLSLEWGQGVEDTSRLNASGIDEKAGSHFLRAMSERSEGFSALKLSPDKLSALPMKDALLQVADAFKNTESPADRARIAFELFGRAGHEMIPVLETLQNRLDRVHGFELVKARDVQEVKAFDRAVSELGKNLQDINRNVGHRFGATVDMLTAGVRVLEMGSSMLSGGWKAAANTRMRQWNEDYKIEHADELEKSSAAIAADHKKAAEAAERVKKAMEQAREAAERIVNKNYDAWQDAIHPGRSEDQEYRKQAKAAGRSDETIDTDLNLFAHRRHETQVMGSLSSVADLRDPDRRPGDPNAHFRDQMEAIEIWKRENFDRENMKQTAQGMHGRARQELVRAVGGEDPLSVFSQEMANRAGAKAELSADELRRSGTRAADKMIAAMHEPMETATERYIHERDAIAGARNYGALDQDQADRRKRRSDVQLVNDLGDTGKRAVALKYDEQVKKLTEARANGLLDDEGYRFSMRKAKQGALSEYMGNFAEVSPVAAMGAGSSEAYSLWARTQANSGREQIQQEMSRKLDALAKIEENTRGLGADRPNGGAPPKAIADDFDLLAGLK